MTEENTPNFDQILSDTAMDSFIESQTNAVRLHAKIRFQNAVIELQAREIESLKEIIEPQKATIERQREIIDLQNKPLEQSQDIGAAETFGALPRQTNVRTQKVLLSSTKKPAKKIVEDVAGAAETAAGK